MRDIDDLKSAVIVSDKDVLITQMDLQGPPGGVIATQGLGLGIAQVENHQATLVDRQIGQVTLQLDIKEMVRGLDMVQGLGIEWFRDIHDIQSLFATGQIGPIPAYQIGAGLLTTDPGTTSPG